MIPRSVGQSGFLYTTSYLCESGSTPLYKARGRVLYSAPSMDNSSMMSVHYSRRTQLLTLSLRATEGSEAISLSLGDCFAALAMTSAQGHLRVSLLPFRRALSSYAIFSYFMLTSIDRARVLRYNNIRVLERIPYIPARLSGCFHLVTSMPTYAVLDLAHRLAFFVPKCSQGEKGESRPMKDRLCPGTTPYSQSIQIRRG